MANAFGDVAVAKSARFFRYPQIARVHKLNPLRRLLIEQHGGVWRIRGGGPVFGIPWLWVRLLDFQSALGISRVAVRAAEHDVWRSVHRMRVSRFVALQAASRLPRNFRIALVNSIARRTHHISRHHRRHRNLRAGSRVRHRWQSLGFRWRHRSWFAKQPREWIRKR